MAAFQIMDLKVCNRAKVRNPPIVTGRPHDYLFRVIMDDPDRAATLLREYLPPALSARMVDEPPKLLDGTYVDENSRMTQSDYAAINLYPVSVA